VPFVIHFFVPEMIQSSPSRTAVVCRPATSLPAHGSGRSTSVEASSAPAKASLMARQMNFLPAKTSGRTRACSSGVPKLRTGGMPMVFFVNLSNTSSRANKRYAHL
jgi:hypothetical protein